MGWQVYKQEGKDVLATDSTMIEKAILNSEWSSAVTIYKYRQQAMIEAQWQDSKLRDEVAQHAKQLEECGLLPMADEATPG